MRLQYLVIELTENGVIISRTSPQRTNSNQHYINNINRQFSTEESVRYST